MAWHSGIQGLLMTRAARQCHGNFTQDGGNWQRATARARNGILIFLTATGVSLLGTEISWKRLVEMK